MIDLLFSSPKLLGAIAAVGAIIAAVAGAFFKGRAAGKQAEQVKNLKGQVASKEEQLEMQREGKEHQDNAASMTDEAAREEAKKWAR